MFHPKGPSFWELARQALTSTERGYDLLAPKFEYTPFCTPQEIVAPALRWLGSTDAALDLCCGTGVVLRALLPQCRHGVGLDISQGMLREAARRLGTTAGGERATLVRGDALAMPFERCFDLAVCFGALGHFPGEDGPRLVQQLAKILKPGGRFAFATGYRPPIHSKAFWLSHGFNAAMRARNLLIKPPFVMYYLTFMLPEVQAMFEAGSFQVEIVDDLFEGRWRPFKLAVATLET